MAKETTQTVALDDMTTEQLVQLSQGIGRQVDDLRAKRQHIRQKIDSRLKAEQMASIQAQMAKLQADMNALTGGQDAKAPGKVMKATAKRKA